MASHLDPGVIRHVAHLARLELTEQEAGRFAGQLSRILDYVNKLNELNTEGIPPLSHPLPLVNVFRADEALPPWDTERALENAPDRQGDFFRVPKVLDQETA